MQTARRKEGKEETLHNKNINRIQILHVYILVRLIIPIDQEVFKRYIKLKKKNPFKNENRYE